MPNFHDVQAEAYRLLRQEHPLPYSLDQKCQQMSGYYMQWAIQGNEIGIDTSGSADIARSKNQLFGGSINDPNIPVGALLYWTNNHVMRKIGFADGRTIATNTSVHGDRIESTEKFWGISHADTYPGPYAGWSARDGHSTQAAPYSGIDPWPSMPAPVTLAGNQRQVKTAGYVRVRAEASTISAELGNAAAGSIVTLAGWKHGETVDGNDIWFTADTTAPYRWSWSGGFTDTGTHDLTEVQVSSPELEPAAPDSSAPEPPAPDVSNSGPDLSTSPEPDNPVVTSPADPTPAPEEDPMPAPEFTPTAAPDTGTLGDLTNQAATATGNVLPDWVRKYLLWPLIAVAGTVTLGILGYYFGVGELPPKWVYGLTGVEVVVLPIAGVIAMANPSKKASA